MIRQIMHMRSWMGVVACLLGVSWTTSAWAATATSCDITTGASCLWGKGCDCDHDGYVANSSKAAKYCHLDKCPLDSDDKDANKLGAVSANNADGDGWTKNYDCDDADKCIGKTCGVSTCTVTPPDPDNDKDGFPASKDCNDNDANVKPGAGIACCDCLILADAAKVASLGCTGCPLSQPQVDAGSTDTASTPDISTTPDIGPPPPDVQVIDIQGKDLYSAPDLGSVDNGSPSKPDVPTTAKDAGGSADTGTSTPDAGGSEPEPGLLSDAGSTHVPNNGLYVGGGTLNHGEPPAPGCSASRVAPRGAGGALMLLLVLAFGRWLSGRSSVQRALVRTAGLRAVTLLLAAVALASCVRLEPWQRQRLAHRCMIMGRNAGEMTLEQHTFQYREGAAGGFGGGGGGCGCN